jgi:hypothetical protein
MQATPPDDVLGSIFDSYGDGKDGRIVSLEKWCVLCDAKCNVAQSALIAAFVSGGRFSLAWFPTDFLNLMIMVPAWKLRIYKDCGFVASNRPVM